MVNNLFISFINKYKSVDSEMKHKREGLVRLNSAMMKISNSIEIECNQFNQTRCLIDRVISIIYYL